MNRYINPADPGDFNPWVPPPVCTTCRDARWISPTRTARRKELVRCPDCGDESQRNKLWMNWCRLYDPPADITEKDLTPEEVLVVQGWRRQNFHMADCLRWIEGRRYDPEKDPQFLEDVKEGMAVYRRITGRTP